MRKYINRLYFTIWWIVLSLFVIFTMNGWFAKWQQGLDLAGWVRLLYNMDFSQYKKNYKTDAEFNQQRKNVIGIVKKNIDSRISKLWVSDYNARYISLWLKDYIEVSLWWIDDIEKAKKIIWKTVQMTFKAPYEWTITPEIKAERQVFAEKLLEILKNKQYKKAQDFIENPEAWNVYSQPIVLSWQDVTTILGSGTLSALTTGYVYPKLLEWKVKAIDVVNRKYEEVPSFDIYMYMWKKDNKYIFNKISVAQKPLWIDAKSNGKLLNGERFKMATVSRAPSGEVGVSVYFDDTWRKVFCDLTKKYLQKPMAIFIWNKLATDPVIRSEICGWVAQITWNYTSKTAQKLADDLNTGAMPVSLKLEQEEKVSPVLWEKAFKNAVIAGALWVVLIFALFWIFYGIRYALVTLLSLWIFFVVLWAFIKLFGVVLSLSAIGAILLNIGMAVDANVIIFERVREELQSGSSFITALEKWYENSISAIRDGNLTTGLIAFLLFMIWTNIFKWFGTMMIINIFIVLVIMVPAIPGLVALIVKKK